MNNIDPIQEELAQAGEASPITPSLLQLDSCRIMTDTVIIDNISDLLPSVNDSEQSSKIIQQPKYYDKVFTLATEKRIVKSTIAKNGRVVVIPIPS